MRGNRIRLIGIWPSRMAVAVARAWHVPPPAVITIAVDKNYDVVNWKLLPFDVAYSHYRQQGGFQ